eukprot:3691554-Ditylum_brightwellii.AAC.1
MKQKHHLSLLPPGTSYEPEIPGFLSFMIWRLGRNRGRWTWGTWCFKGNLPYHPTIHSAKARGMSFR